MLCTESFPETEILKEYFEKMWRVVYSLIFPIFWIFLGECCLQFSFKFLQYFLKTGVILAHFKEDGNLDEVIASLKSRKISFKKDLHFL